MYRKINSFKLSCLLALALFAVGGVSFKLMPRKPQMLAVETIGSHTPVSTALGRLPLSFEANRGLGNGEADFVARGAGYSLALTATEARFALQPNAAGSEGKAPHSLRMQLKGANAAAQARGLDELPRRSNYLVGRDAARWRTNIAQFRQAKYESVYPGVDVVYYGAQGQLEYDFIVAPNADPRAIELSFEDADEVSVNAEGELILRTSGAEVRQRKPVIYQEVNGQRHTVAGGYVQTGAREIGFVIDAYNRELPLVIDPVILYSTFLGGDKGETGYGIERDAAGNIYVMGRTNSMNFPVTAQALRKTTTTVGNVFIAKINPAGTALVYATYFGTDQGGEDVYDFKVDAAGNAYLTGRAYDANFPLTTNAARTTLVGPNEAYVAKLNPSGSTLLYSSFLGGSSYDEGRGIAFDAIGNIYVTGHTASSDFPTTDGAYQKAFGSPGGNGYVVKINPAGAIVYATYLGGSAETFGNRIVSDDAGNTYIAGIERNGATGRSFVLKLNPNGSQTLFNVTLANARSPEDLVRDNDGNLYLTGYAFEGTGTPGAYQATPRGFADAFAMKLDAAGALVFFTFLGGIYSEVGNSLAVDTAGNVYVAGWTISPDFPTRNAPQSRYGGGGLPYGDGFVSKLNATGTALIYSTFVGESDNDYINDIAVDRAGNAYVVGAVSQPTFRVTTGALQRTMSGPSDAFVLTLGEGTAELTSVSAASYLYSAVATESIIAAFGANLALGTQAAGTNPLPTSLGGTTVMVKDSAGMERLAPLFFVSPNQINYQIPLGTAPGTALVRIRNANNVQTEGISFVERVAPSLFSANATGQGVAAALILRVKPNGAQSYEAVAAYDATTARFIPRPLEFGQDDLFLVLFGSGLRYRNQLSNVQAYLQGIAEPALYAGSQGDLVGLDQVNVRLPKSLIGRGEISVVLSAEGNNSNEVKIAFK